MIENKNIRFRKTEPHDLCYISLKMKRGKDIKISLDQPFEELEAEILELIKNPQVSALEIPLDIRRDFKQGWELIIAAQCLSVEDLNNIQLKVLDEIYMDSRHCFCTLVEQIKKGQLHEIYECNTEKDFGLEIFKKRYPIKTMALESGIDFNFSWFDGVQFLKDLALDGEILYFQRMDIDKGEMVFVEYWIDED